MSTKKLLVAFDSSNSGHQSGDFLIVVLEGTEPRLIGVKSKRPAASGLMVYVGKNINANDLFKKLVDTGRRIEDVEQALRILENYVQQLQDFRIGNILSVEATASNGFKLTKLADAPPRTSTSKLP